MSIEDLTKQRLSILSQLDRLTDSKIPSDLPFLAIGKQLEDNLNAIRALRIAPEPLKSVIKAKVSQPVKVKIVESEGVKMTRGITVKMYHAFKKQGMTDKAIREKVGLDNNNKFYKFKQDNGLIKAKVAESEEKQVTAPVLREKETQAPVFEPDRLSSLEKELADFKVKLKDAMSFIESLKIENASLNEQVWGSRLQALYAKQAELESFIAEKHGISVLDYLDEQQLAILVELAESANEWQGFKYWKQNKNVDREKVLEETVDVLHLILARGIALGWQVAGIKTAKTISLTKQYTTLMQTIAPQEESKETYESAFNTYVGLVEMLGFTWSEVEVAYAKKHQENIDRQNNNY